MNSSKTLESEEFRESWQETTTANETESRKKKKAAVWEAEKE